MTRTKILVINTRFRQDICQFIVKFIHNDLSSSLGCLFGISLLRSIWKYYFSAINYFAYKIFYPQMQGYENYPPSVSFFQEYINCILNLYLPPVIKGNQNLNVCNLYLIIYVLREEYVSCYVICLSILFVVHSFSFDL